jgi:Nuclease-related domain
MTQAEEEAGGRGRAGASARAEYERRQAKDEARRRAVFGPFAPVVRFLAGPKPSTESWGRGADGEEHVGHWLDKAVGERGVVLHDRAVSHGRANIDHIAVVASGVWVIDAKHYRGRLERREGPGWFVSPPRLFVAGRDQSRLVTSARRQQALVAEALMAEKPVGGALVRAALCFTGTQVGLLTRPFTLQGVLVTWPRAFTRTLEAGGPLGPAERRAVASRLARAFPPHVA